MLALCQSSSQSYLVRHIQYIIIRVKVSAKATHILVLVYLRIQNSSNRSSSLHTSLFS
jgi:hypothetical protein